MRTLATPEGRLEQVRNRLAATPEGDAPLRVMLVLAHETLLQQALARQDSPAGFPRKATAPSGKRIRPDEYSELVAGIREAVAHSVPLGASVLVVSRGDDELLVPGYAAAHFPQGSDGAYAGYHPADSAAAVAHLEQLEAAGAEFLVLPATGYWWLDHYGGLAQHLLVAGRVAHHDEACLIFDLRTPPEGASLE